MNGRERAAARALRLGLPYGHTDLTKPFPPRPRRAWRSKHAEVDSKCADLVGSIVQALEVSTGRGQHPRDILADLEQLYLRLREEIDARWALESVNGDHDPRIGELLDQASALLLRRTRLRAEWGALSQP
jgi:hypothetical protein